MRLGRLLVTPLLAAALVTPAIAAGPPLPTVGQQGPASNFKLTFTFKVGSKTVCIMHLVDQPNGEVFGTTAPPCGSVPVGGVILSIDWDTCFSLGTQGTVDGDTGHAGIFGCFSSNTGGNWVAGISTKTAGKLLSGTFRYTSP